MNKLLLFTLVLGMFLFPVTAANNDIASMIDKYGPEVRGAALPSPVNFLFGNERVDLALTLSNGSSIHIGIVTKDGKVQEVMYGRLSNPTMLAFTTQSTLQSISTSKKPLQTFTQALDSDKITYHGVGFFDSVKTTALAVVVKVVVFFNVG